MHQRLTGLNNNRFLIEYTSEKSNCCGRGQSYKASMIVIYEPRIVNMSNLLLTTTLQSKFMSVKCFIRLTTGFELLGIKPHLLLLKITLSESYKNVCELATSGFTVFEY